MHTLSLDGNNSTGDGSHLEFSDFSTGDETLNEFHLFEEGEVVVVPTPVILGDQTQGTVMTSQDFLWDETTFSGEGEYKV